MPSLQAVSFVWTKNQNKKGKQSKSWYNRKKINPKEFKVHVKRFHVVQYDECNNKEYNSWRERRRPKTEFIIYFSNTRQFLRSTLSEFIGMPIRLTCKYLEFRLQCDPHNNDSRYIVATHHTRTHKRKQNKTKQTRKKTKTVHNKRRIGPREREREKNARIHNKCKTKMYHTENVNLYWAGVRCCFCWWISTATKREKRPNGASKLEPSVCVFVLSFCFHSIY